MASRSTKATAPSSIWKLWKSTALARFIDSLSLPSLKANVDFYKRSGTRVDPHTIGRWGEHLSACRLKARGYKILYRNFQCPRGGEIDLVCRHGGTLVFVEVKTRTQDRLGAPRDAVDAQKQRYILKAASYWLSKLDRPDSIPVRCDVMEVILEQGQRPRLNHLEAALEWRGR